MIDADLFDAFLQRSGLKSAQEPASYVPLTGGVSSDIYRVDLPGRTLCIKRALQKLKVAADWTVPVSRSAFEWRWLVFAAESLPGCAPAPLAHDPETGLFAMAFLEPSTHPVWKDRLLAGAVDSATATAVGAMVGRLHAASTARGDLPANFASDENFHAIRLDPYLHATAARHPDLTDRLCALAARTAQTRKALVHGDVSPKNILVGPEGPVLLDAECAWWGDPAFDAAFCLNHLLLKRLAVPAHTQALRRAFAAFAEAYFGQVTWEDPRALERRTAELLPALMLARVDGKSPVEYITQEAQRQQVRSVARAFLARPASSVAQIAATWFEVGSP